MTAEQLIVEVRRHGAEPLLIDRKLKVAPPGKLPADLKNQLHQHAEEIKTLLSGRLDTTRSADAGWGCESRTRPMPTSDVFPDSRHPLIPEDIRAKIEIIEADARVNGWPAELLWNAGFWDCLRGLAAVLDPEDEIGEVTQEYIEILKTRRYVLKFRRIVA